MTVHHQGRPWPLGSAGAGRSTERDTYHHTFPKTVRRTHKFHESCAAEGCGDGFRGREVYRKDLDDNVGPDDLLDFPGHDIFIPQLDFSGFLVTLLTGRHSPDEHALQGWRVCEGTTVKFLLDHDAFAETAELFQNARDTIYLSQLYFQLAEGVRSERR